MFLCDSSGGVGGSTPSPSLVQKDGQRRRCPDGEVHVGPQTAGLILSRQTGGAAGGARRGQMLLQTKKRKTLIFPA